MPREAVHRPTARRLDGQRGPTRLLPAASARSWTSCGYRSSWQMSVAHGCASIVNVDNFRPGVAERLGDIPMSEVTRVLAPNGVAYLKSGGKWEKVVKPRPKEMDEWTHEAHDPGGNCVSADKLVKPHRQGLLLVIQRRARAGWRVGRRRGGVAVRDAGAAHRAERARSLGLRRHRVAGALLADAAAVRLAANDAGLPPSRERQNRIYSVFP